MDRVREVRDEHPGGRPRSVLLPVAPVLVRDAEVVCRAARIARGDACTAVGQRVAVPEVLVGDGIKARAGAELHQDSAFPVPPSKARNLRVVAVKDPGLGEGRGRRHTTAVAVNEVSLGVNQVLDERHVTCAQGSLQGVGADPVDMQDDELAAHLRFRRTPADGRRRGRFGSTRDACRAPLQQRRSRRAFARSSAYAAAHA